MNERLRDVDQYLEFLEDMRGRLIAELARVEDLLGRRRTIEGSADRRREKRRVMVFGDKDE